MPLGAFARRASTALASARPSTSRAFTALSAGNGDFGRLGHGQVLTDDDVSFRSSNYFHPVRGLEDVDVTQCAAGGAHSIFLAHGGFVFACGLNNYGQLGHGKHSAHVPEAALVDLDVEVVRVAAGNNHTLCVDVDGGVWAFGKNEGGQLGTGLDLDGFQPRRIETLGLEGKIVDVACGAEHSLALSEDGRVYSWGTSADGVLGHGSETWNEGWFYRTAKTVAKPRLLRALSETKVRSIAAGHMHSACVDERGELFTWGQGRFNQLGQTSKYVDHETAPKSVDTLRFVHQVTCGGLHTLASTSAGVVSWGANQHGELGHGSNSDAKSAIPKPIKLSSRGWSKLSAGWKHSAGVSNDGKLFAWGFGGSVGSHSDEKLSSGGQLGLGNDFDYWEPTEVWLPGDAVGVSCGFNHTLALVRLGA
ncbi:Regulator of chromosome condensation, RCC1 [Ostreococcus tauri]|uniref:Regulator of chromosome condensation 1/beta-lactamase-inhibitor protein II n=1 Tax=Ostreococcus tauri TaxID=70448 RepID=A0A090N351_OSTTA|nr:Regulator of chromosome condensation, RCC1 [Ostreococcus tauri]OUS49352.1 regulator of chromosome condensation 1/beta-lactamase-inhibitor protein II [Ostreococcus tauri]CEF97508.1 Regulator of chromosome condensation, RCC1 [Ostreococcus tauri]|eukprot:XP_003078684.2 Regulator of chromosome condensation, RCC1 [Ostreococcus tauri]